MSAETLRKPLNDVQLRQLRLLKEMDAVTEASAVDRRTCHIKGLQDQLDMAVIARMRSSGLVARKERPAQYGEPARRLYYLTRLGFQAIAS